jgi:zinc/manganese transport system permease protein
VKQLLIGSILTVTPEELGTIAALYAAIGLLHFAWRRGLIEVSFDPLRARLNGRRVFFWDCVFYGSFALVVTSSVRIAGVLLVFAYLIIPAALAVLFAKTLAQRLLLAWALGAVLTACGLYASWAWDLPTGPAIVSAFGAALALVALGAVVRLANARTFAQALFVAIAIAGLLLAAFPRMDQPWLDALYRVASPFETVFLDEHERATRADTIESLERARSELGRLRELEQDVRWGRRDLDPEKVERLRQYIAGRSEIAAGEELVLRGLRETARGRQRWLLGLPLLLVGAAGFHMLRRRGMHWPGPRP